MMIKQLLSFAFVISLLAFASCEKESTTDEAPAQIDNYINFNVDQVFVECDFKVILQDHVFNAYYKQGEAIELQRLVENGSPQRMIFKMDRIDLENTSLPITINYSSKFDEPTISATYVDADNVPFGTNINNGQDFSLTINSYDDQVINCSFSGSLFSGITSNPKVDFTEGDVNLELEEY